MKKNRPREKAGSKRLSKRLRKRLRKSFSGHLGLGEAPFDPCKKREMGTKARQESWGFGKVRLSASRLGRVETGQDEE